MTRGKNLIPDAMDTTVVLAPYFQAYVTHVCPLRRVPPRACVAAMRVPPPLVQARHLEIAADVPDGVRGLVIDLLARDEDDAAAFVLTHSAEFQTYTEIFAQAAEIGAAAGWTDGDPVPRTVLESPR